MYGLNCPCGRYDGAIQTQVGRKDFESVSSPILIKHKHFEKFSVQKG